MCRLYEPCITYGSNNIINGQDEFLRKIFCGIFLSFIEKTHPHYAINLISNQTLYYGIFSKSKGLHKDLHTSIKNIHFEFISVEPWTCVCFALYTIVIAH